MGESMEKDEVNRNKYFAWLSSEISIKDLQRYKVLYSIIDNYCYKCGLVYSLFSTKETRVVADILQKVQRNRDVIFFNKGITGGEIQLLFNYYFAYLKRNQTNVSDKNKEIETLDCIRNTTDEVLSKKHALFYNSLYAYLKEHKKTPFDNKITFKSGSLKITVKVEALKEVLDNASWAYKDGNEYCFLEKKREKELIFSNVPRLWNTRPTFALYFDERIENVSSWNDLYVGLFEKLYEDYYDRIPLNESFLCLSNNLRIISNNEPEKDFCSSKYLSSMKEPKKLNCGLFLEQQHTPDEIIRIIRYLLKICLVDEENIVIKYIETEREIDHDDELKKTIKEEKSEDKANLVIKSIPNEKLEGVCDNTSLDNEEKDNTLDSCNTFAPQPIEMLSESIEITEKEESSVNTKSQEELIKEVLIKYFPKGYRYDYPRELALFRARWEELYHSSLSLDDEELEDLISYFCIEKNHKLFVPEVMISEEVRDKIFSYIDNCFNSGVKVIYYKVLFEHFYDELLGGLISDEKMLGKCICGLNNRRYGFWDNYISPNYRSYDPHDDIKEYLVSCGAPAEKAEIFKALPYISKEIIEKTLNNYLEFICNSKGMFFYIDCLSCSDDDKEAIIAIIQDSIDEKGFISSNELLERIKTEYPVFVENNFFITERGLRSSLKYYMKDSFSFNGNIISRKSENKTTDQVFSQFSKSKESFKLDELRSLCDKIKISTSQVLDSVFENSFRISQNQFVAKSSLSFNTKEIDAVLDRFCIGNYISLSCIDSFVLFPDVGFTWNKYLLESYVYSFSNKYKLIHSSFWEKSCIGTIVKKNSNINCLDDLLIEVLSSSEIPLEKEKSLDFLFKEEYLGQRSYKNIDSILIKANEKRNQKR